MVGFMEMLLYLCDSCLFVNFKKKNKIFIH